MLWTVAMQQNVVNQIHNFVGIMWYKIARDICSLLIQYKIINDEVSNSLQKFGSE